MAPALWLFISLFPRNIFPYRAMAIFPENVLPVDLCVSPEYLPIPGYGNLSWKCTTNSFMCFPGISSHTSLWQILPENVPPIHLFVSPEYLPIPDNGNPSWKCTNNSFMGGSSLGYLKSYDGRTLWPCLFLLTKLLGVGNMQAFSFLSVQKSFLSWKNRALTFE